MGERKVLNKYYPPDFDPAKLPRAKQAPLNGMKVRMMMPMSIRCNTCGTFTYKGTKFNSLKEDAQGEEYLGMRVFRFHFRCKSCAAGLAIKTDWKNGDYVVEAGATRNHEPWREPAEVQARNQQLREEEERGNAMKALENRTLDSKREMDTLSSLDDLYCLNSRLGQLSAERVLQAWKQHAEEQPKEDLLDDDDDTLLQLESFLRSRTVHTLDDQDEDGHDHDDATPCCSMKHQAAPALALAPERKKTPKVVVKPKRKMAGAPDGRHVVRRARIAVADTDADANVVTGDVCIAGLVEYGSDGGDVL